MCLCLHIVYEWENITMSFSHIVQSAPACECNWADEGKILDHLCRYCPWLPTNQHAVVTLSQWWLSISHLIALHSLVKSQTIESKVSLVRAIYQHHWLQFSLKNQILVCHNSLSQWPCDYIFTSVGQDRYGSFLWAMVALEMLKLLFFFMPFPCVEVTYSRLLY